MGSEMCIRDRFTLSALLRTLPSVATMPTRREVLLVREDRVGSEEVGGYSREAWPAWAQERSYGWS